jgi:putative salt-induced outer membrane protein YdiY
MGAKRMGVALVLALVSQSGEADTVILRNGDRLSGQIERIEDGKLSLRTEYAGEVKIDLKAVLSLLSDAEMTVVLENGRRLFGRIDGDANVLNVAEDPAAVPQTAEVARLTLVQRGHVEMDEWEWSGRVNVGASDSSGNSEVTRVNADAEVVTRRHQNRVTVGGRVNYALDHGEESESNANVYAKYDHFVTRRWYAYGNTTLEHDRFKDLRLRTTLGVGSGYQVLQLPRTNFALELGLEHVSSDYYATPDEQFPAVRLASRFDHWLKEDVVQLFQISEGYMNLEDYDRSFVRTQTGLRFPLAAGFLGQLQLNVDWEGNPPPGRGSTDETAILSLGYQW